MSEESSTDYSDEENIYLQNSQALEDIPQKSRKRSSSSLRPGTPKKQRISRCSPVRESISVIMTLDEKKELISLLDSKRQLVIYDYLDFYNKDVLVKCFVDMFLEYKVIPVLPPPDVIDLWLSHNLQIEVSNDLMKKLVNNFIKYFQTKYFNNNVNNANQEGKLLFNPKTNFWIPGFSEFPEKDIEKLNEAKFTYAREVQNTSSKGTAFVLQNRILRIIDWTMQFIQRTLKITDDEEKTKHLEYIMAMAYKTAMMEFPAAYRPKVIDWSAFKSKGTTSIPNWRSENKPPPEDNISIYSKTALQKIDNGDIQFNGTAISEKNNQFMQKSSSTIQRSTQQSQFRRRGHHQRGNFNRNMHRSLAEQDESQQPESSRGRKTLRGQRRNQFHHSTNGNYVNQRDRRNGGNNSQPTTTTNKEVVNTFI